MKSFLLHLDKGKLKIIKDIGRAADAQGVRAYAVGGMVRDLILKKETLDFDILVDGSASALAETMGKKWGAQLKFYSKFKTASLCLPNGMRVDFATARKETYVFPGALPCVRSGSLREDLFRRDFTINTMALALNLDSFGRLVDFFNGYKDLKSKKVRVLHDQSFLDDPTRILRAIRFEQRLHFRIERRSQVLLKAALTNRAVTNVKAPRYFVELTKMLAEPEPLKNIHRLYHLGAVQLIHERLNISLALLRGIHRRMSNIKSKPLFRDLSAWKTVYWMGIFELADEVVFKDILKKFPFTRKEYVSIKQSRKVKSLIQALSCRNLEVSRRYLLLKSYNLDVIAYVRLRTDRTLVHERVDRFLMCDRHVRLRITGDDLKSLGCLPGHKLGRILENVLCLKLDGNIRTKQDELIAARRLMKRER